MNKLIRKIHRWVSMIFTLTVAAIFVGLPFGDLPQWLYYLPPLPLALLLSTGLYLFVLPHLGKWRGGRHTHSEA